jgi:hypothetical protein
MQIGGKCIESLLMNMVFEKKTLKRHKFEKKIFHASSLGNGLQKLQFGIVQSTMTTYGT